MRMLLLALGLTLTTACVPKAKYDALEDQYKDCNKDLKRMQAAAKRRMEAHEALMKDLQPLIDKKLLEVEVVEGRTTIGMRAEILFPSGSAVLSADGKSTVQELARVLSRRTEAEWQVEGHTDDDAIKTDQYPDNWYLGADRAINVLEAMVDAGMNPDHISAATFGMYSPIASNNSADGKQRNRRIEIVLLPAADELFGYDELMKKGGIKRQRPDGVSGSGGNGKRDASP